MGRLQPSSASRTKVTEHGCAELCFWRDGRHESQGDTDPYVPRQRSQPRGRPAWTALGCYFSQPLTMLSATGALQKAQAFTKHTRASSPLSTMLLSSYVLASKQAQPKSNGKFTHEKKTVFPKGKNHLPLSPFFMGL